ncbi:bis(5'-nucleosyl)-tetraphosphatase (symmetrical) YqeK [Virgibacillus proomii]|uniref:bis(5'-nucleosyl)-tetraphosphatase (symmetrical) YqeK n=1 Tax=Virgibacillus proomii TaxID=84407 RepID=UPI001C0FC92B|nr:bis(5'-nucleosyl)-tetraphosphatase (symmetrical) YqeK [Virgibacillus proomii]MBU5265857.1 bis(5'-nucleosyl)-tetraphosphatase (symmetrical) YqeK [Virgibacillus proomii]
MDIDTAIEKVKPQLTKERFAHSLRVADLSKRLANQFGENEYKAELAGVLHDYAKYRSKEEMARWILTTSLPKDLLQYHHELWHGPVGALLLEKELGIQDKVIQEAVRYHTTGKAYMSKLEMIIFLADYIEPGRKFPGVDKVREVAKKNLEQACFMALAKTIQYLLGKQTTIYPDTFHAYNYFNRKIRRN